MEFTSWDILRNLLLAARWTVLLSLVAFATGSVAGLAVLLLRVAKQPWLRRPAELYIAAFQGTPLLMQLFLVFFGLPLLGFRIEAWSAAVVGLTLCASAFLAEIWRGGVEAVPRGQWEGARALALGYFAQLRFVILPQASRIALPPTVGFLVQLVKGTSLASIIGFTELTRAAAVVNNATFRPLIVYTAVAGLYFVLCWPLSVLSDRLERRLDRAQTQPPSTM